MAIPRRLRERLDYLGSLTDGWLDGRGLAPDPAGVEWLATQWARHYPDGLPLPGLYPTSEGAILAEWSGWDWELSVEIDPASRQGQWYLLRLSPHRRLAQEQEGFWDLGAADGWAALAQLLRDEMAREDATEQALMGSPLLALLHGGTPWMMRRRRLTGKLSNEGLHSL